MRKKIKVVWICHFSNHEIQKILKPWKLVGEMAPWIPSLIKVLEDQEEIELHIISPHEYLTGLKQFELRGVNYFFFNAHIPIWGRHWPGIFKLDVWTRFVFNKLIVSRIIKKLEPDIIHLQGAENAYYSSTIFQFKDKYPILITLQGFLHKVTDKNSRYQQKMRVNCELDIYKQFNHFGIRTYDMGKIVQNFNKHAVLHWHGYGIKISLPNNKNGRENKYDLVFFARITLVKGIEDFLKVISILKKQNENISALIIGAASPDYLMYLKEMVENLNIVNNVTWTGFLPTQSDVHNAIIEAKICVLPVKYDMIPGTIIESMYLGLPVVTYNVGSISEVNAKEEVISIVEKDDINGMVDAIQVLLSNKNLYQERAKKAYERVVEMTDYDNVKSDLLNAYNAVIVDFKKFPNK